MSVNAMESERKFTRRVFAAHCGAAALFATGIAAAQRRFCFTATPGESAHLISGLRLETGQSLLSLREFYVDRLGFELLAEDETELSFKTGRSHVTFAHVAGSKAQYHFAFNIPENQALAAHAWQRERSKLITPPERLVDAGMPREVVAFRHWNAHSVFFHDPARNVVEYIARHDLDNASDEAFNPANSALCVSEIGLVTEDVPAMAKGLAKSLELETYVSSSNSFHPLGDQHGLILVMKRGGAMAFGAHGQRDIFKTGVEFNRPGMKPISLSGHPYELSGKTKE